MIDFDNSDLGIFAIVAVFLVGSIAVMIRPESLKDIITFGSPVVAAIAGIARPKNGQK